MSGDIPHPNKSCLRCSLVSKWSRASHQEEDWTRWPAVLLRCLLMGPGLTGDGSKSHFTLNNGNLKQSLTKYSLETKWNPQPVFVNKVFLACSHTHFLWLVCVCFHTATAKLSSLQQRLFGPVGWPLPWRVISIRLLFKRSTKIGTVQQYMSYLCYIYHYLTFFSVRVSEDWETQESDNCLFKK